MEGPVIIDTGKDLARSFRDVRGNTITIADDIRDVMARAAADVAQPRR